MKPIPLILCLALLIVSSACTKYGGIGRPGSVAWKATATEEQKEQYNRDRISSFKQECKSLGFENNESIAFCAANQLMAERKEQKERRKQAISGLQDSVDSYYTRPTPSFQPVEPKKLGFTDCSRTGRGYSCYSY